MIRKDIPGYEFVKNVAIAEGYEYCNCNLLFVVKQNSNGDYLGSICEVAENKGDNYDVLREKYPFKESGDGHLIWYGCVEPLPFGGDMICFCWS